VEFNELGSYQTVPVMGMGGWDDEVGADGRRLEIRHLRHPT